MLQNQEEPNERTTLLAKHKRSTNSNSNSNSRFVSEDASKTGIARKRLRSNEQAEESQEDQEQQRQHHEPYEDELSVSSEEFDLHLDCSRMKFYLVEPMVLILVFAYNFSSTVLKNQIIYQTCTAIFEFNETDCKLLGTKNTTDYIKHIEKTVQPYAATIFMTTSIIQAIVPAVFGMFIGPWSDRFGRKPLFIAAFGGYAIYYYISSAISYFSTKMLVSPWYYLLAGMPHALMGGSVTYSVATFCYISDVFNARQRPYRMAFYEVAVYMGLMIGAFASGYVYEATNSTIVFLISAISINFALLIIIIFVPESLNIRGTHRTADINKANAQSHGFIELFDFHLIKEMWKTCFKPRQFNDRSIIWLTIVTLLVSVFVIDGSITVFYLFIREKFEWTVKEYTIYESVSILVPTIGNLFGIMLLRKWLKISVVHLAILAFVSLSASSFMKAFAYDNWQLYLAIVLGALKSFGNPMCRTILTNVVPGHEVGKIFSLISVLQSMVPFISSPVYTVIYSITLSSFPGFFNVLSANLFIVAIMNLLFILRQKRIFPAHYELLLN